MRGRTHRALRLTDEGRALIQSRWPELLQERETRTSYSYGRIEPSGARPTEDGEGWIVPIIRRTDRVQRNGTLRKSEQETPVRVPASAIEVCWLSSEGPAELTGRFG